MRYFYKDTDGQIYEYGSHAEREQFGPEELVPMSDEEVTAHLAPVPPTPEQAIESMRVAIQSHMDSTAQAYGYDDVKAAVTYADEPAVPKFQAEGRAFRAWRSLVWSHTYGVLDEVQAGEREQPTVEEVIAELPELIIEV